MQRVIIISVVIAAGLMALVVGAAFLIRPGPHARIQAAVDGYANVQLVRAGTAIEVEFISHALHPERFTRALSVASYSDNTTFDTTAGFRQPITRTTSGKPLPFPPDDLWCVRLWRNKPEVVPHYIFVARHNDLYNAEWVLHEPSSDPKEARAILDVVQCSP